MACSTDSVKRLRLEENGSALEGNDECEHGTVSTSNSNRKEGRRKFKKVPIFVVDYHNDVLQFLSRCFGGKYLPLRDNLLIHFDSHPDMVLTQEIRASECLEKDIMLNELSIENWIMPLCYGGIVNRIVWVKNDWCKQIPEGTFDFRIGDVDNYLKVDLPIDYYLGEGNYAEPEQLQNARKVKLYVLDGKSCASSASDFIKADDAARFILDFDLDFFTTKNPFLELYPEVDCINLVKDIFSYKSLNIIAKDDFQKISEGRADQLNALKDIFDHLQLRRSVDDLMDDADEIVDKETLMRIRQLVETVQEHYSDEDIDWELIYNMGVTTDNDGLPHHLSTDDELEEYFKNVKSFLQSLPCAPVGITVAKSTTDNYCPVEKADEILKTLIKTLISVFGDAAINEKPIFFRDDNDEIDLRKL